MYQAELLRKFGANITVVVKSIDCITPEFEKEVATMLEVVHPNIVCLYGLIDEGIGISIIELLVQTLTWY